MTTGANFGFFPLVVVFFRLSSIERTEQVIQSQFPHGDQTATFKRPTASPEDCMSLNGAFKYVKPSKTTKKDLTVT